jgi:molybdopterin-containing oxidoreductase family iron-sulfur binding subunit
MSQLTKEYWTSLEERDEIASGATPETDEFPVMPVAGGEHLGRRDFLKMSGFAVGVVALNGCVRGKEREVVPYLTAAEEIVPGRAYSYATVCGACPAACGVLAKALDGRPIKLEGNPDHPLSAGGLCAIGQASVLGLWDSQRLRHPLRAGEKSGWDQVDAEIMAALERVSESGGKVRFLTDSTTGPAERAAIESFLSRFADGRLVTYDPLSLSAIADAHAETHGTRAIPRYRLDRAEVIVSFGADFLGSWISPVEHARAYRSGRRLDSSGAPFSQHVQLESRMSLTGGSADRRVVIPPLSTATILAHLAERLAGAAGVEVPWTTLPPAPIDEALIAELSALLSSAPRGRAVILCGENDIAAQRLTNFVNELLGGYDDGGTVDLQRPSRQRLGVDGDLLELREELAAGTVDALFVRGVNPVYDLPFGQEMATSLDGVDLLVSFAERVDETAAYAGFVCPEPHFLESWGDSEPAAGIVAVRQPVLRVLGQPRPLLESFSVWSGRPEPAHDTLRRHWRETVYPLTGEGNDFDKFWNKTLHDGWATVSSESAEGAGSTTFQAAGVAPPEPAPSLPEAGFVALAHASMNVSDGRHAHNPWLLELPDPVGKTTWDNVVALAPATAARIGATDGDEIEISLENGAKLSLPAQVQPGQHPEAIAVPLGWGRRGTDRFAKVGPQWLEGKPTVNEGSLVGINAAPLISVSSHLSYGTQVVSLRKTGAKLTLATTQRHHSLSVPDRLAAAGNEPRPIVRETTLHALEAEADGHHGSDSAHGQGHHEHPSLYPDHEKKPHHWGLAIDLTACNGCSACVTSCQAENNIPVVGRDEVSRSREMHWMRIDRYYSGDGEDVDVVHMPMLCQHCDNAPCENVCPVQATAQSAEGLNQQIYNRCVGTRYCANNCPFKVRRFNWFDYPREDRLQNMALNPHVTVRSRGVMEKCSMCVQRIQEAKSEALARGAPLADGDIDVACAQSCPAQAIVFGDRNDPESRLARLEQDPRHYRVLDELGVKPVVGYLSKVRNRAERSGSDEHA